MNLPHFTKRGKEIAAADAFVKAGDRLARIHDYTLAAQYYQKALTALNLYSGSRGVDPRIYAIQERLKRAKSRIPPSPASGYVTSSPSPPIRARPPPSPAPVGEEALAPPRRLPAPPPYKSTRVPSTDPEMERVRGYITAVKRAGADVSAATRHLEAAENKGSTHPDYENNLKKAERLADEALDRLKASIEEGYPERPITGDREAPAGKEEFECPDCGAGVGGTDDKCLKCGAEFETGESEEPPGLGSYAAGAPAPTPYEPNSDSPDPDPDPVPEYVPSGQGSEAGQGNGTPRNAPNPEAARLAEEVRASPPVKPGTSYDGERERILRRRRNELLGIVDDEPEQ